MSDPFVYHFGGHAPAMTVRPRTPFAVFTEDAFGGKITAAGQNPRERAPFPKVNPLVGPIAVEGVRAGDLLAVHLIDLAPARDWGVSTVSPNFGALSGTRLNPNLQPAHDERVWIWRLDRATGVLATPASEGSATLTARLAPFHGIVGVAPPHGEVRLSVVPDVFGGNLDLPDLAAGATLYLRAHVDGAHLYLGDGHYAQGDGELAGTAVEGALNTRLVVDRLPDDGFEWPRIETDTEIGAVGCARPLEDAVRIATHGLVRQVAALCGLSDLDAYQVVTQSGRIRIGNLVNPLYSAAVFVRKDRLPGRPTAFAGTHAALRAMA